MSLPYVQQILGCLQALEEEAMHTALFKQKEVAVWLVLILRSYIYSPIMASDSIFVCWDGLASRVAGRFLSGPFQLASLKDSWVIQKCKRDHTNHYTTSCELYMIRENTESKCVCKMSLLIRCSAGHHQAGGSPAKVTLLCSQVHIFWELLEKAGIVYWL